jgi:hypothetical protein
LWRCSYSPVNAADSLHRTGLTSVVTPGTFTMSFGSCYCRLTLVLAWCRPHAQSSSRTGWMTLLGGPCRRAGPRAAAAGRGADGRVAVVHTLSLVSIASAVPGMAKTGRRSVRYDGEYFHHFNISFASPWLLAVLSSPRLRVCRLRLPRCSSLRFCHPPSPWDHLMCCCCPPRPAHCQRLRKPRLPLLYFLCRSAVPSLTCCRLPVVVAFSPLLCMWLCLLPPLRTFRCFFLFLYDLVYSFLGPCD